MVKRELYRYLGTNGVVDTPVHIPNAYSVPMVELVASPRHQLFNGERTTSRIIVAAEDVNKWKEISVDEIN